MGFVGEHPRHIGTVSEERKKRKRSAASSRRVAAGAFMSRYAHVDNSQPAEAAILIGGLVRVPFQFLRRDD